MALSHDELAAIAQEAGLGSRTIKKLERARAKLAGETPVSGKSKPAFGHGAPAQDSTPLVSI